MPEIELEAVRGRVCLRRGDRVSVAVAAERGGKAQLRRADHAHSRAAADIEQGCSVELADQLEAKPRRRMRTGGEGPAGVDRDRFTGARFLLPWRHDPEAARAHRPV